MFVLEAIINECRRLSESVGDDFNIPVSLNARLTRTLGRVHSECVNGVWRPVRMEFSTVFIKTSTKESIMSVIQHEWAHYYTTKTTKENHGHDETFKAVCARIGCTNDKTRTHVDRIYTKESKGTFKYQVFCPTCNKYVSGFSRMCKLLREIDQCICKKCGNGGLSYIQNW